jgi:hypothetical protein
MERYYHQPPWERRRLVGTLLGTPTSPSASSWERRRLVGILGNADVSVGMTNGKPTKKPERRLAVASFTGRRDVGVPRCRRDVGAPRALLGRSRIFTL